MKLHLERHKSNSETSIGILRLDGAAFCFTLEDQRQPPGVKIRKETRIPAGTYPVGLRGEGGLTKKYAASYPDIHRGMLWLRDVPGFDWIYIHVGNTDDDTEGCILVGDGADLASMTLQHSRSAYRALYTAVVAAAVAGDLEITIEDRDQ